MAKIQWGVKLDIFKYAAKKGRTWPVRREATHAHTNAQSRTVSSYAMTVMDKIDGWEEEEKWVGSRFAACMWIYITAVLCLWRSGIHARILEAKALIHHGKRQLSLRRSHGRTRVGFWNHHFHAGKRHFGGIELWNWCFLWSSGGLMWFSPLSRLNQRFADNGSCRHCLLWWIQHGACMLRSVAAVLERAPDEDWDVGREMIGCGLGEWLALLPYEDDCATDVSDEGAGNPWRPCHPLSQE